MHYNRSQRRKFAKQLGLLGSKGESQKTASERRSRSMEAGRQIHHQFLSENEVNLREADAEREAKQLISLTESHGAEEAARIIANNKNLQRLRDQKLAARKLKGAQ